MASTFYRFATVGGDNNAWGAYVLAQERKSIGEYSSYLFDDAGTLTISAGQIGISDGTNTGLSDIDETTIALTGTAGIWQKIEMGVSGSTVTFYSTDLAGETDPATLPAAFTGGYVDAKRGYYIIGTRRTIGVVWVDSGGTLGGIINGKSNVSGYQGRVWLDTGQTAEMTYDKSVDVYSRKTLHEIGTWNMDSTASVTVTHYLGTERRKIKSLDVAIISDNNEVLLLSVQAALGGAAKEAYVYDIDSTLFKLSRVLGGTFDSVNYDSVAINRGYIECTLTE